MVVYPYEQIFEQEEQKEKEWNIRFDKMLREGRKIGKAWLKKKGIDPKTLTEEKTYELIDED
ncbi:hypothetical protein A3A74_04235 [Candidatus Roizmanbacteria bacterium RIFCSPLOWO2_01_FULL_35_13]|uniref:Uncharacterized protein n=1 Tax=Candidatus Roizmanbacteria bacterium RIFCSPLOWO2_01_FULL_35_13 TaxID=1802055 RepID=A0A1F7ICX2_9BACT|nr:MAG: hypothetical protein A3A74_04235 [Candidatus Roizmanbacteria bacterium RIFCSPLOWO2_01_FULL_35_13]